MNRKELVILSAIILSSVIAWIILGVYHTQTHSQLKDIKVKEAIPLTPVFDNDIINSLQQREE